MRLLFAVFLVFSMEANAENVKLGGYSGRVGNYVKIGNEFQLQLDAMLMNADVQKKVNSLTFKQLSGTVECDVEGMQQAIGTSTVYTIFKIKSCK
ncbi:MAG: hypothetical protein V4598_02665 [Bdellovibrionota bacterium]